MHACMHLCMYVYVHVYVALNYFANGRTAILIIIEGQFQIFQRFSSTKLVLRAVKTCYVALNCFAYGRTMRN